MKRLYRNSLYDRDNSNEVRIEQLERRFVAVPTHWAVGYFDVATQSVSSGGTILTYEHFRSTSSDMNTSSLGGAVNNTAGDNAIRVATEGVFLVTANVVFQSGAFDRSCVVNASGGGVEAISNWADIGDSSSVGSNTTVSSNTVSVHDEQWFMKDLASPTWFNLQANVVGVNKNATSASMTVIMFRPSDVDWGDTSIY